MAADEPTARGDADLETTHLNPLLDRTVLDNAVLDGAELDGADFDGAASHGDATSAEQGSGADEAEEEWPPREWRETTRSAGHRQAAYVALGMVVIFAVLVLVAIWASHNG
ncbi:MAG TPA: pentapeptide repeat-containing protein [Actinocrinis sp.]|jgi:hypothetical protein|uniref:pentapeptide repeat-containing protein n=1 Tax=Actinocrinis sp. TaxID=1920516 RepID=UPI002DDD59DB|nr:pentapeptide repeat-containing protein [Actinocrinis sp.]HEV3170022.1 pentapeptide repeat-containing protein [Actinocrinis sp.]